MNVGLVSVTSVIGMEGGMVSRLLAFPLTRLVIYTAALSILMILFVQVQFRVLGETKLGQLWWMNLIGAVLFLTVYWMLVRLIERRKVFELATPRMFAEFGVGGSVEGLLVAAIIAIFAAFGAYTVHSVGVPSDIGLSISFLFSELSMKKSATAP